MSKMGQHFYDTTRQEPDAHMPDNEPCFCAELPPEFKAMKENVRVLDEAFNRIFGNKAPLPF